MTATFFVLIGVTEHFKSFYYYEFRLIIVEVYIQYMYIKYSNILLNCALYNLILQKHNQWLLQSNNDISCNAYY